MTDRLLFIAGASGAVGRTVVRLAGAVTGTSDVRAHYRKPPPEGAREDRVICALDDRVKLDEGLRGVTTVVQLIGTMRKRFAAGDTYETSDVGTTHALVEAARTHAGIDHFILLSSVGAGRPVGAYLRAKARAEALVRGSGMPWTIFRPSAFEGEGHRAPPGSALFARLPGLKKFRPIAVEDLARAILHVGRTRGPLDTVLEGDALFELVQAAR